VIRTERLYPPFMLYKSDNKTRMHPKWMATTLLPLRQDDLGIKRRHSSVHLEAGETGNALPEPR